MVEAAAKGTGRHVSDLTSGLLARGVEVHLLYSPIRCDDAFRKRLDEAKGLKHTALPMRRSIHFSDYSVVRTVHRYMREHGPFDAIHGHSSKGGGITRLAALGSGVPAFYTPHGLVTMDLDLPAWRRQFYRAIEVSLSWLSARVIAVSPEEARSCVDMGMPAKRVATIPNGAGAMQLTPRAEARRKFGLDDDTIVVGSVGRLVEYKAPDILIRSFAIAVQRVPQMRLVLIGAGPMKEGLEALAVELDVADKVVLAGEMAASGMLEGFDVFAIASRKEGLPYVVLEAMIAGLPVVATTTSGVELLVETGINGLVVGPDDSDALGAALVAMSSDVPLRKMMGEASRRMVTRFTPEAMVDQIIQAYRDAAPAESEEAEPELAVEAL